MEDQRSYCGRVTASLTLDLNKLCDSFFQAVSSYGMKIGRVYKANRCWVVNAFTQRGITSMHSHTYHTINSHKSRGLNNFDLKISIIIW